MEFKDILSNLLEIKQITPYRIGKDTPVSKQSVMKYLSGDSIPSGDNIVELSKYLNVTTDYLLGKEQANTEKDNINYLQKTIPLLPISAQGGALNDFMVSVKEMDCEQIISPIRGVDFAITVSGESMYPEYPNGSQILVKRINEKAFIDWGRVYVLDTVNGTVIKRIVPADEKHNIRCLSINPDPIYAPFDVALSDVYAVYRVLMCMSMK